MGKNKKKGASRVEKASAKREKKIAQRIKKDIGKIGEVKFKIKCLKERKKYTLSKHLKTFNIILIYM